MSQIQPTHRLTARPGHGVEGIVLGSSIQDIEHMLGAPNSTTSYSEDIWWVFLDHGIDCCFSISTKKLTALNFFREGVSQHRGCHVVTEEGVGPGTSKDLILAQLGKPDRSGEEWTDSALKWHRSWISYSSGIAFEFGQDLKADLMTLFRPSIQ